MVDAFERCNNVHTFLFKMQSVERPLATWNSYPTLRSCGEVALGIALDVTREENKDRGTTFVPQRTYLVVEA